MPAPPPLDLRLAAASRTLPLSPSPPPLARRAVEPSALVCARLRSSALGRARTPILAAMHAFHHHACIHTHLSALQGADPILTDADALITRDPTPFIARLLPEAQILVTSDHLASTTDDLEQLEKPGRAVPSAWNIGYFYLHHSTLQAMLHWQAECAAHPTLWDQNLFKDVLKIGGLAYDDPKRPAIAAKRSAPRPVFERPASHRSSRRFASPRPAARASSLPAARLRRRQPRGCMAATRR